MTNGLDKLFGDDKVADEVVKVPIDQIHHLRNHPFSINWDRVKEYAESMKTVGQLVPLLIREDPEEPGDEIIAGHHRYEAAKMIDQKELDCIYKNGLSDAEIMLIVTDSNLQRGLSDLSHSELARVLYERHKALSKQGIRTDLIKELADIEKEGYDDNQNTGDKMEEEFELSAREISRYLRIYELIVPLKDALDNKIISKRAAVDLSYADKDSQNLIAETILGSKVKMTMGKAKQIKEYAKADSLNEDIIAEILSDKSKVKPIKAKVKKYKLKDEIFAKYFQPDAKDDEVTSVVEKALEMYYANQETAYSLE